MSADRHIVRSVWLALLVIAAMAAQALGASVGPTEARQVAERFIAPHRVPGFAHPLSAVTVESRPAASLLLPGSGQLLGYVVELSPVGYVVVSADTSLPPVIAYSDRQDFPWEESPDNLLLNLLREDLTARLRAVNEGALPAVYVQRAETTWTALGANADAKASQDQIVIGPLLEATTWAQVAPWNDHAPIDPATGERSLTGCVATALAQLISYWRYPDSVTFTHSGDYITPTRGVSVSAPSASIGSIDYASRSLYNPNDDVMADLSYAAGVSVQMDYTSVGSSAYLLDFAYALAGTAMPVPRKVAARVWGYESADVRSYVMHSWGEPFIESQSDFYRLLRANLQDSIPVALNFVSSATAQGHAVLCDGYDTSSNTYHLNLGWGGQLDGWYNLPEGIPSGYNVVEYGVFNICPPPQQLEDDRRGATTSAYASKVVRLSANPLKSDIRFTIADGGLASFSICIYSNTGRLLWQQSQQGESEVSWDGRDSRGLLLANGTYIYVASGWKGSSPFLERGVVFILR